MTRRDYKLSLRLVADDPPFYALLMAAMRQADSDNLEKLKQAFPLVHEELAARYNAPGGFLGREMVYWDGDHPCPLCGSVRGEVCDHDF